MTEGKKTERRHFSREFKLEAVRRTAERRADGVPMTQIARELGITDHLVRAWRRQSKHVQERQPLTCSPVRGAFRATRKP